MVYKYFQKPSYNSTYEKSFKLKKGTFPESLRSLAQKLKKEVYF